MLDWQSLGGDPCNQLTVPNSNESYELVASIDSSDCDYNSPERCLCEQFGNASDYECFWNPVSRITGEYCERCRPVCLSKTHTLSFVQLFVGMVLLSFCLTPGRSLVTVIASDIAGNRSQVYPPNVYILYSRLEFIMPTEMCLNHKCSVMFVKPKACRN